MRRLLIALAFVASLSIPPPAMASDQSVTLTAIRLVRRDRIPVDTTMQAIAARRVREYAPVAGQPGNHHGGFAVECCLTGEILGWTTDPELGDAVAHVVSMWLASPSHKAVLLGRWTGLGIGVIQLSDKTVFAVDFIRRPATVPRAPKNLPTATPTSTQQHVSRAEVELDHAGQAWYDSRRQIPGTIASAHALVAIAKLLDELIEEIAQLREELVHQYRSGEPR